MHFEFIREPHSLLCTKLDGNSRFTWNNVRVFFIQNEPAIIYLYGILCFILGTNVRNETFAHRWFESSLLIIRIPISSSRSRLPFTRVEWSGEPAAVERLTLERVLCEQQTLVKVCMPCTLSTATGCGILHKPNYSIWVVIAPSDSLPSNERL